MRQAGLQLLARGALLGAVLMLNLTPAAAADRSAPGPFGAASSALGQEAPPALDAVKIFVAEPDFSAIFESDGSTPQISSRDLQYREADERGSGVSGSPLGSSGEPAATDVESAFPLTSGSSRAADLNPDINQIRRQFGAAVERSPQFELVESPQEAMYVLRIVAYDTDGGLLDGYLHLIDPATGTAVYARPLNLSALTSIPDLRTDADRNIGFLERWLRTRPHPDPD